MAFESTKRKFELVYRFIFVCGLALIFVQGCAPHKPDPGPVGYPKPYKVGKKWYQPMSHARDFVESGTASWYGRKFHGRKTSNGEVYNMYAMTAAHKTLPFGTHVRVHNLKNNRWVDVRVNDRGPFVRNRIIDLSYAAAKKIGMVGPGTVPVKIVALGTAAPRGATGKRSHAYVPGNYYVGNFTFQVGSFRNPENAERLKRELDRFHSNAHIKAFHTGHETLYRVRVGRCATLQEAIAYEKILIRDGFKDAFVVAD